jgi:hypothetical protein
MRAKTRKAVRTGPPATIAVAGGPATGVSW